MASSDKIQVEIWSDIQCPFCYIGKRQFETALAEFEHRDKVEVTWKSYQLDPELKAQPGESIYAYLARRKGMSVDQSKQMHDRVAQNAATVGLDYQFEKMVVANSLAAHRLIQMAKSRECGDQAEEALFRAYFTEGMDLGDRAQLKQVAESLGLGEVADEAWEDPNGTWGQRVREEASEAATLGSTGVPFFVFQRQYAVTGAQGVPTFQRVLETLGQETL